MNRLKYWYLLLALGILIGIALAIPSKAQSPTNEYQQTKTETVVETSTPISTVGTGEVRRDNSVSQPVKESVGTSSPVKIYDKEQVKTLIYNYSIFYGVNPELPLRIARCESGLRWDAKNSHSTASGIFQYLASTWRNTEEGRAGISVFDADANVRAAVRAISKSTSPWNASKDCWN